MCVAKSVVSLPRGAMCSSVIVASSDHIRSILQDNFSQEHGVPIPIHPAFQSFSESELIVFSTHNEEIDSSFDDYSQQRA